MIGAYVADELYGSAEKAYGETIKGKRICVSDCGVVEQQDDTLEEGGTDDFLFMPYSCAVKMARNASINNYTFTIRDLSAATEGKNLIENFLYEKFKNEDLYTVTAMSEMLDSLNSMIAMVSAGLGGIAGISLLVAGVGVMNIMLVSVTERTREIGIRKALGAKRSVIMQQFVIEAAVTSSLGGVIGILLGSIATSTIGALAGLNATPTPMAVIVSFSVSVGIGLLFGYMPASRAAKLNPIDALRVSKEEREHEQKNFETKIVFWRCPAEIMFCFRLCRDVICCLQMPAKVCASHCCGSSTACVCVCDCPQFPSYASDKAVETVYLVTPAHVWWETDTTGKWSSVSKAHEYQVKLYIADSVDRDEDNWRKVDFDDESMEEAECVMTKRTRGNLLRFQRLHWMTFTPTSSWCGPPKVSEQAYVKAGSWVGSPDADYRAAQVIGYTDGKWRNYLEGSRYQLEDGSYLGAGWQRIEASWYLLDDQGYRLTGWQERDGNRYYLGETGQMATDWFVWNDNWYYADKTGAMQTGWVMTEPGEILLYG